MAYEETIACLENFTDIPQFERMACDILSRNEKYRWIEPQSVGKVDGGKDALLETLGNKAVVFHFSLRKDWETKLKEDLNTVKNKGIRCESFVFVSNRAIGGVKKDRVKNYVKKDYSWLLDIYDQERLRVELDNNCKDLREKYLRIPENSMEAILEKAKSSKKINFESIHKLCGKVIEISKNHKYPETMEEILLPIEIKDKISINSLSSKFEEILKLEMTKFSEIDEYLRSGLLTNYEQNKILSILKALYLELKGKSKSGDEIFSSMIREICPNNSTEDNMAGCITMICYFFQACEVFEHVNTQQV